MRISHLKITEMRCFSDFELTFKDEDKEPEIIFLAGENGSGKSTILWALASGVNMVLNSTRPNIYEYSRVGKYEFEIELTHQEKEVAGIDKIGFRFNWEDGTDSSRWISGPSAGPKLTEHRRNQEKNDRTEIGTLDYLQADRFISAEQADTLKAVAAGEVETRNYAEYLNLTRSRKSGKIQQSKYRDVLRQYGTLLQTDIRKRTQVFDYIKNSQSTSNDRLKELVIDIERNSQYEKIRKAIMKYLPGASLDSFDNQSENPPAMILRSPTNERIDLVQLSSGEFQIVVWLIDLIQKELHNSIILWDEPEQHLHPSLSMKIPDMLREFCPDSQIWIATQSPFIVSSARTQDRVYYLHRNEAGTVEITKEAESKVQAFRRLTPNGFLATWGKQVVFVEGEQDVLFFQSLLENHGIDAIAAQLTSKPGLKKLDSILNEIKDTWDVPMAVAVVDRDYHTPDDFSPYPLITYYSQDSCDLEGLFLEPRYMNNPFFVNLAKTGLEGKEIIPSSDPVKQLIEHALSRPEVKNILYREYFNHSLSEYIGDVLRGNELNINNLQGDATQRLSEIISSYIPSLSVDNLSFEYPEILTWCKGKKLLPVIGDFLGIAGKKRFFSLLAEHVERNPPQHIVDSLRRWSSDFNS